MREVLDNAELLFCCVDTPPTYSGDADLSRVEAVIDELGDSDAHAIVMKSTVPVGTGRSIQRRREGLGYISNPEFLKEGTAVADFMHPDRVVVGAGDGSDGFADRVAALYEPLGGPIVRTDVASAEMIKLASNAFLATKISFINEIANVSEELGADVSEVARGMGLDARIGAEVPQRRARLRRLVLPEGRLGAQAARRQQRLPLPAAQLGDRGQRAAEAARRSASCRSTSARSSARRSRCSASPSSRTPTTSARRPRSCSPRGCRARAPTCASTTRSRSTTPTSCSAARRICGSALEALDGADAAVLVTEWPEFAELDWAGAVQERMAQPLVVDGRNFLDREALRAAGFTYEGIGRRSAVS